MIAQNLQTLKRKHPDTKQMMAPLNESSTMSVISEGPSVVPPKRTRDDHPSTSATLVDNDNAAPEKKKQRVSMPVAYIGGKTTPSTAASESVLGHSKSRNTLNSVSPVQLLRTFQLERKHNSKFDGASFVKPNEKDLSSYDTTVVNAVRNSNLDTLRSIHKTGKSLNACNQFGESLLHMACRRGNPDVVRFMVEEAKVNVNVRDDYGRTILHDATWTSRPNFNVMDILLKAIQPEMLLTKDVRGHTPFDYARKEHWAEWVGFLSERKEKIEPESREKKKSLQQVVA